MRKLLFLISALALPLAAAGAQQAIDRPGTVPHREARAFFPERVGQFRRSGVVQYDTQRRDISASYVLDRPEGQLVLSVYIYPTPRPRLRGDAARALGCRRELEVAKAAIVQRYPNSGAAWETPAPAAEGVPEALRLRATYRFRGKFGAAPQDLRSDVYVYCPVGNRWMVKYRVTGPAELDASEEVEAFIRRGPWPRRAAPPDRVA